MAQFLSVAHAVVAIIAPAAIFFWAYGRYDGLFKDNVVFLYFIGGLLMGGFLGFMSLLALELVTPLVAVVLLALIFPIGMTIGINRRKWQGERHAVFNGGAFGLGSAVMLSFTFLFRIYPTFGWVFVLQGAVMATGLAGLFFGLGLLAGNSVRARVPFRVAFLGTAIAIAPVVFLEEFYRQQAWLFPVLLAAYGLTFGILAERRVLVEGLEPETRRGMRRRARRLAPRT